MALPELPDIFGNYAVARLEHLAEPAPVPAWPPAPGWLVLAALLVVALCVFAWKRWRRWQRNRYRREALAGLRACRSLGVEQQPAELARLLKITALTAFPRQEVAALSGDAWLDWLARHGPGFSDESRGLLAQGQYRVGSSDVSDAIDTLARECESWVRGHQGARP